MCNTLTCTCNLYVHVVYITYMCTIVHVYVLKCTIHAQYIDMFYMYMSCT